MKLFRFTAPILLFAAGVLILSGCVKQKFDEPPVNIPHVTFPSNVTIAGLKAMYKGNLMEITADTVIQGIVSANDESGNIYKKLYIQDNSGGIEVELDQVSLYTEFSVGQRVFIKCKGLYLGDYYGLTELGYLYNGAVGRIPVVMMGTHIFRDSLPGTAPAPVILNLSSSPAMDANLSMLVRLDKVRFPDKGQPFVAPGDANTNHNVADSTGTPIMINGNNLIIRTSSYANFSTSPLPAGKGSLVGILSVYSGQYQLYIRDINDVIHFDTTGIPPSMTTIYENNFDNSPTDWVVYSVKSNKDWSWDGTYKVMVANGYLGDVPSEDWLISPAIDLTHVGSPTVSFKMWTKYTDSGLTNPFEVFISTNYSGTGDPTSATWTTLPCTIPAQNSASWTSSGDIDLSAYHQKIYIGYRYKSSGVTSSTASKWEVDTFKVVGLAK